MLRVLNLLKFSFRPLTRTWVVYILMKRSKTSAALVLTATVFLMKTERNKSSHISTAQGCHPLARSPILPGTIQFLYLLLSSRAA
jgi:hypothetical protein